MLIEDLRANYRHLEETNRLLCAGQKKKLITLSLLRLLVFAAGGILTGVSFQAGIIPGILVLLITIILFLYLLFRYEYHSERRDYFGNIEMINRNEINALSGDLSPFNNGNSRIDIDHDFSNDIDLFGEGSLFHYLNRTVTGQGMDTLAEWLADPYRISGRLKSRQEAISELSSKLSWRQEFIAYGTGKPLDKADIEGLLSWLNDKSKTFSSLFLRVALWLMPSLAIISLILLIAGYIHYSIFTFIFLINLLFTLARIRDTGRIHILVSKKYEYLSSLSRLLYSFEKETFKSSLLCDIKNRITGSDFSAVGRLKKLSRIIQSFDSRLNLIVGVFLNGLILWDFHCIRSLEKWKAASGNQFPEWLKQVGEVDAYISLSNFAFNNPEYCYPELSEGHEVFSAAMIGHPLIPGDKRICNDFQISDRGEVFIITGANMAGKSTFLRTVAVNYILAMCGAPVCATKLTFKPLKLFTSMRTTDSLSHNESYFYSELKRLKSLKLKLEEKEELLFILDEILKGTNSADKSNGSRLFIKKIIELGGTGLIATHDNALGEMEKEYPGTIVNKCFEIEIEGENIRFDYKLREGITLKMNAGLLMKQMGIA